jgi:DNA-binding transcriptional ArsR family regulator
MSQHRQIMSDLDGDILDLVARDAVTPDEVAKRLRISWATANGHLLKLVGEGKVLLIRKGRVNVYRAKSATSLTFQVPKWVRQRSLEELSEELAGYFPKNMTAAEMIEKERRKA